MNIIPKKVAIVIEICPHIEVAEISPNPIVITVMKTYHIESSIEAKIGLNFS